jgi:hypothetical protein
MKEWKTPTPLGPLERTNLENKRVVADGINSENEYTMCGFNFERFNEYMVYLTFIKEDYIGCIERYVGIMECTKLDYRLENKCRGNTQSHVDAGVSNLTINLSW